MFCLPAGATAQRTVLPHEVLQKVGFILTLQKVHLSNGRRWRDAAGKRLYEWDARHGELEMYNAQGRHLGAVDPQTGALVKAAVKGRKIDV